MLTRGAIEPRNAEAWMFRMMPRCRKMLNLVLFDTRMSVG